MKKVWYVQTRGAYNSESLGILADRWSSKAIFGCKKNAEDACEYHWHESSKPTVKQGVLLTEEEYKLLVDSIDKMKDLSWNLV